MEPRVVMEMTSNETIKQAVMAGMGISFLSLHTIGLEWRHGLLAAPPVEGLPLTAVLKRPDGVEYSRQLVEDQGAGGGKGAGMVYMAGKPDHKQSNDGMIDHIVELVEAKAAEIEAAKTAALRAAE